MDQPRPSPRRIAASAPRLPVRVPLHQEPLGIWGSFRAGRRNILELIPEIATHAPILSGRTGKRWHMLMDPDALKHVLRDRLADYPKSLVTKLVLGPAIGKGMFIAEGAEWQWQRRTAAPVFTHRNVAGLAPVMTAAAERACARLEPCVGGAANMFDEMVTATFEVISDVTFSGGPGFDRAEVHRAIEAYIASAARVSLLDVIGAPAWVPRPGRIFGSRGIGQTKALADRAIEARRLAGARFAKDLGNDAGKDSGKDSGPPDLLDLLLAGADPETGQQMTTEELRDNLLTFIVAGHETTALTLSWALYLCAFDPVVQEEAREEAQSVLQGRAATVEDLASLPLTRRIIDETLRLYPPAAFLSRTAMAEDELCGREVRPGDNILMPIYALHRHHRLWEDPDAFNPARFADPRAVPRFQYLPFGDGPRICIGMSFALQEAVIILATLLARYRFTEAPGSEPKPVLILTLRPEGGVWLKLERA